ncbi:hypothetical protein JCM8097_005307 [Rhodosporidiobolus ruineniae]
MDALVQSAWTHTLSTLTTPPSHLAAAQRTFQAFLDPLSTVPFLEQRTPAVDEAYNTLLRQGLLDDQLDHYSNSLRDAFPLLRHEVDTALFQFDTADSEKAKFEVVLALLHRLGEWIQRCQAPVHAVWTSASTLSSFRRTFLSHLHSCLPPSFAPALQLFLRHLLSLPSPPKPHLTSSYPHLPLALPTLLTLLDRFDPLLFGLIYEEIQNRVERECAGAWGEKKLEGLLQWLNGGGAGVSSSASSAAASSTLTVSRGGGGGTDQGVLGWVSGIYLDTPPSAAEHFDPPKAKDRDRDRDREREKEREREKQDEVRKFLKPTFSRFEYHVHKMLGQLRTTELYDIILAFPSSQPALEDLRTCLQKTDQRPLLLSRLSSQLRARLLHPGTATEEVLRVYVALVRALRIVDPPGVLMSRAAGEVRAYLRSRKDTIHHIVSSLISPSSPLYAELQSTSVPTPSSSSSSSSTSAAAKPTTTAPQLLVSEGRDEAENYSDPKWAPEPVDAPDDFRKSRAADILQLLVSIYDTKAVFVQELQVLLAQRLLAIKDYGLEAELKTLETLKLRFGDAALQGCDVMLKDLEDSREVDRAVHSRSAGERETSATSKMGGEQLPLHATVVSRLFWPSFQTQPLKLPGQIGRAQSLYSSHYTSLKPSKKLRWLTQLGSVNLSLSFEDGRTVTAEATVVQASVVELFGKQDTWTLDALASTLKLSDPSPARNALHFWSNLGVLRLLSPSESGGAGAGEEMWRLVEHASAVGAGEGGGASGQGQVVEEEQQAVRSVEEERVEQMRVFWQFIQGMLTNLGALPLARIHSTLSMLAPGYKGRTTDELTRLLQTLEGEGLVQRTAKGDWKVVKQ